MAYRHHDAHRDLTVTQAARLLGVSVRTVQRACDDGAIAHRRESNGYRRITRAAVEAYQRGTTVVEQNKEAPHAA